MGEAGQIATSADGETWTRQDSGTFRWLFGVAWSGDDLRRGRRGRHDPDQPRRHRLDGARRRPRPEPAGYSLGRPAVRRGGKRGAVLTSADGVGWSFLSTGPNTLNAIAWSGSEYVAVGGELRGWIQSSSDGATWTRRDAPGSLPPLYGVAWSGSEFLAVGDHGEVVRSVDGVSWLEGSLGIDKRFFSVAWTGGLFEAVGEDGAAAESADGFGWSLASLRLGGRSLRRRLDRRAPLRARAGRDDPRRRVRRVRASHAGDHASAVVARAGRERSPRRATAHDDSRPRISAAVGAARLPPRWPSAPTFEASSSSARDRSSSGRPASSTTPGRRPSGRFAARAIGSFSSTRTRRPS